MRRFLISTACAVLIAVAAQGIAYGHGSILRATPGPGDAAQPGVDRLEMEFTTPLLPSGPSQVEVVDSQNNNRIATSDIMIAGNRLTARIQPLEPGVYLARYTVTTNDGHPADGGYFFSVQSRSPSPGAASGAQSTGSGTSGRWDSVTLLVAGGIALQVVLLLIAVIVLRRNIRRW